jgi:predicted Zn-dependent protease
MSDQQLDVAARVVALCDPGASAEVTVRAGQNALTRFANSFIHQNVGEDTATVSLKLSYDGRTANATTTYDPQASSSDLDDALRSLVERTAAAARLRPADPDWPGLTPPTPTTFDGSYDPATGEATPADRAALVRDFVAAAGGLETAGFCETVGQVAAFANSAGQSVFGRTSWATLDGVARSQGADASARRTSGRLASLDGTALGERAAQRVSSAIGAQDVEPGPYEVVLGPSCVADLLFLLAWQGFNGRAVNEGRSFVKLGEQQFDESFQLWDDPADPRTVALPFDGEGTPHQRVDLVRDGRSVGLSHDRRTAKVAGTESVGHSVDADAEGALACNLLLGTGSVDTDGLVAQVERGLLVTDFWYTRMLDPRTLVVTGLTRNGVFLVEDGKVVRPVANLRFTQSYADAVGPGRVLGLGSEPELHPQHMTMYSVPALRLASWNFTGGAKG